MSRKNITIELRSYNREVQTHQHDYHQLVFPISGQLDMSVDNREGDVSLHKAALISAGKEHGFSADKNNCFLVADVPSELAPELERLPSFITIDNVLVQYVIFLQQKLLQGESNQCIERQMILLLLQLLQERFGGTAKIDKRIDAVLAYLEQNFHQPISMLELVTIANLSQRQLSELFRRQMGMTPQQYLIEKRMQKAWQMLDQTQLSVQQVADNVGYTNLSAFSDRFRKHFGHSPRYFRRMSK